MNPIICSTITIINNRRTTVLYGRWQAGAICGRAALIICAACATARPVAAEPARPEAAVWVDASAPGPGDGTGAAPFKSLSDALARAPARIELRSGLYRGPFELPAGTKLVGHGAVVLFADREPAVVTASMPVELESLSVQGGLTGLRLDGGGSLKGVDVTGAREVGLSVGSGRLRVTNGHFKASFADAVALSVEGSASVSCEGCLFEGPFRHGVDVTAAATLALSGSRFEGPVTGLQLVGGKATVEKTRFSGGRGPAIFASHASLEARGVDVDGQEYALLARDGAQLTVRQLTSRRAQRAGLGLVKAIADLEDVQLIDPGNHGGLQMIGGDVTVRRFRVEGAASSGITARQGTIRLEKGTVSGVRPGEGGSGNGVELRAIQAVVRGLEIRGVAGVGLMSAEAAKVALEDVTVSGGVAAGIESDTLANVTAHRIHARQVHGPALLAQGGGRLDVDGIDARDVDAVAWAECGEGSRISLAKVDTDTELPSSPCVDMRAPP